MSLRGSSAGGGWGRACRAASEQAARLLGRRAGSVNRGGVSLTENRRPSLRTHSRPLVALNQLHVPKRRLPRKLVRNAFWRFG